MNEMEMRLGAEILRDRWIGLAQLSEQQLKRTDLSEKERAIEEHWGETDHVRSFSGLVPGLVGEALRGRVLLRGRQRV